MEDSASAYRGISVDMARKSPCLRVIVYADRRQNPTVLLACQQTGVAHQLCICGVSVCGLCSIGSQARWLVAATQADVGTSRKPEGFPDRHRQTTRRFR